MNNNEPLTMADVKANNAAAGQTWFGEDEMRWFNSRIESELIDGRYFISSELSPHQRHRLYSVREAIDGGQDIRTVGDFQEHSTLESAQHAIEELRK